MNNNRPHSNRLTLIILGAALGIMAGALLHFFNRPDGGMAGYTAWCIMGAIILGALAPLTNGRIISLLFLRYDLGSHLVKTTSEDYSYFGAFLTLFGLFLVFSKPLFYIFDKMDGWQLYVGIPGIMILFFGWMPLLWRLRPKIIMPIGIIVFACGALSLLNTMK